ncbi:MAG: DICT sensory domain-containing protein [Cyanobacteria bacterium P01_F01_bin.143]
MLEGSILQKLKLAHQSSSNPLNLGVYYKNTLVALCHALEDFVLESDSKPMMVTAFQRGKWYLEEAERYGELADKSSQITIMATSDAGFEEHPTSQKDNVAIVNLGPDDPVGQEWHLMILSPCYTAMVLCQELSESDYGVGGQPQEDLERKFYGFWTFEPELVKETVEIAIAHIQTYNPALASDLSSRFKAISQELCSQQQEDLGAVVSRVIDYLQTCHKNLHQPQSTINYNFSQDLDDNILSNEMQAFLRMAQILDHADTLNPMAATEVAALGEAMGQLLDLPAWQIKRLRLSGLLNRVGSITRIGNISDIRDIRSEAQQKALQEQDDLPKASLLRIMPQLQAIAEILTHQSEAWDGSGKPSGLSYDNIPLESRILRLLADFQRKVIQHSQNPNTENNPLSQALEECQSAVGQIYDPKLVEALGLLVMGMQQGMSIQAYQPKIASGIWLVET